MSNVFNYIFKITSDAEKVASGMNKLNGNVERVVKSAATMDEKFQKAFSSLRNDIKTIKLDSILNNVERVSNGLTSLNAPGMALNSSMADMSAITGVTGKKLDDLEASARRNAKTFGGSAAQSAESYKLLLSQLSPEIAKVPAALEGMGKNVSITSKLMGGDAVAATNVLTTAMNQYQVSLTDPIKATKIQADMMNIMAAAAKEGSAELPGIAASLEQGGLAAKTANVSFAETNSWFQVLDKSGKKGSEGGVALRNVLASLSQGRFLPKDVQTELQKAGVNINTLSDQSLSLADRLKPLRSIMGDQALITKMFGKENSNAAIAMISGIDESERLTAAITGTNTAVEQAAVVMDSQDEKNKRLKARIDNLKISLFNATGGVIGYASELGSLAFDIGNLIPLFGGMATVIKTVTSAQKMQAIWTGIVTTATNVWTGAQWLLNAAFWANPITWIVAGVMALIGAIVWVVTATKGWGNAWKHTVQGAKLLFQTFVEYTKANFNTLVQGIMVGINMIKLGWFKFKEAVGMGDSAENQRMIAQINEDTEKRKNSIVEGYKKVAKLGLQAGAEFVAAGSSIKLKKEAENSGIDSPVLGASGTDSRGRTAGQGIDGGSGSGSKTNSAIATGGSKHNYITIHLGEMIGVKANSISGSKREIENIGNELQDQLLRLLGTAVTAGA